MAVSSVSLASPVERAYATIVGDLMQRFKEMWGAQYPPSAERLLRWTQAAGRDPAWVEANASDLQYRDKAGLPITPAEFETWKHSMQNELLRPSRQGETLTDLYERLRRLHAFEFPTYRDEPYWRWRVESVRGLVPEGTGAMFFGIPGSGKTAAATLVFEGLEWLKAEQIAYGPRSTLAQILGKHVGKGGRPDSPPDPDYSHMGLWYSRDIRFIANYSVFDDVKAGTRSPLLPKWKRETNLSGFLTATADCLDAGYEPVWAIDEGGFAADKYTQGSEKVKSIVGTTRIARKLGTRIAWITQFGPDDFPKELVKSAETHWYLAEPRNGRAQGRATITVPGSPLHQRVVSDIPLPVSAFDTRDKPALRADISMKDAMEHLSLERQEAEAAGERWDRHRDAQSIRNAVEAQLAGRPDRERGDPEMRR